MSYELSVDDAVLVYYYSMHLHLLTWPMTSGSGYKVIGGETAAECTQWTASCVCCNWLANDLIPLHAIKKQNRFFSILPSCPRAL